MSKYNKTWFDEPLASFDVESTGTDATSERIVQFSFVYIDEEEVLQPASTTRIVNPGKTIPEGATKVHGVTNEMAQKGMDHEEAVFYIQRQFQLCRDLGIPVVMFNASYDYTLIYSRCVEMGLKIPLPTILDPLVIDRAVHKYRKGSRKLEATSEYYGVTLENAHDAQSDALAAALLMRKIGERYPKVRFASNDGLMRAQEVHQESWRKSFQSYLRKKDPEAIVESGWPILDKARRK